MQNIINLVTPTVSSGGTYELHYIDRFSRGTLGAVRLIPINPMTPTLSSGET